MTCCLRRSLTLSVWAKLSREGSSGKAGLERNPHAALLRFRIFLLSLVPGFKGFNVSSCGVLSESRPGNLVDATSIQALVAEEYSNHILEEYSTLLLRSNITLL